MVTVSQWQSDNIPAELRGCPQWVCWRYEDRQGNRTKIPTNPHTGANANIKKGTWDFETVRAAADRHGWGVGFVLTEADPYVAFDLDGVIDEAGRIQPWAGALARELGSYTERTPSGRGLRIIVRGSLPPGRRKVGQLELYDRDRYVTLTGWTDELRPIADVGTVDFARYVWPFVLWREVQARVPDLWAGQWEGRYASQSEADLRLCGELVRTAMSLGVPRDDLAAVVDAAFRHSGLMRDKWDEPHGEKTYGGLTIEKALRDAVQPTQTKPGTAGTHVPFAPVLARDLLARPLRPTPELVPNILPIGLTILAGPPKIGKSWLALHVAVGVASGRPVFGDVAYWPPRPRGVLFLALEDSENRVRGRLRAVADDYLARTGRWTLEGLPVPTVPFPEVRLPEGPRSGRSYGSRSAGTPPSSPWLWRSTPDGSRASPSRTSPST